MKKPSAPALVERISDELGSFTVNKYERNVPYGKISEYLDEQGFYPPSEEDHPFMILGHEGRVTVEYAHKDYPSYAFWLQLSWYRMPSGNFEVIAGFQATSKRR